LQPPVKLLDQVRDRIRYKHYSLRTEHSYVQKPQGQTTVSPSPPNPRAPYPPTVSKSICQKA
jgi:hypothetical protein